MAAGNWTFYESFREYVGDGTIDLDTDTFNLALYLSTSNAATVTTNNEIGDLTNEHANGNGYTTGGSALASVTWTRSSGTVTFDSADEVFTASGGSITARFAVIYKSGTANGIVSPLVCYCLLDSAPADVTATDGNTLTIAMNASGIFTLS